MGELREIWRWVEREGEERPVEGRREGGCEVSGRVGEKLVGKLLLLLLLVVVMPLEEVEEERLRVLRRGRVVGFCL